MRVLPTAVADHLASGGGLHVHTLIQITARNRSTSADETIRIWDGADHQTITIDGVQLAYFGVGALLDVDPFTSAMALRERTWSFRVAPMHPQIIEAVREYEARLAPVVVHEWHFDPVANAPLSDPIRVFRGSVMEIDDPTPPLGQDAALTVSCVSDAWRLTRGLTLKRSHEALLARAPGDTFREFNSLTGIETAWGEKSRALPGTSGPPPARPPNPDDFR